MLGGAALSKRLELASSRVGFHLLQKRHTRAAGRKITLNLHFPGLCFEFSKPVGQLAALRGTEMLNFLLNSLKVGHIFTVARISG